jgi:hypothetical protein
MAEPRASSPAIYQLRVVLRGVSPPVWRRLLVNSETPLAELHEILQLAFAWSDDHLHRFLIHGTAYGLPRLGGISFRDDARRVPLSRFRLHRGERFRYEWVHLNKRHKSSTGLTMVNESAVTSVFAAIEPARVYVGLLAVRRQPEFSCNLPSATMLALFSSPLL